MICVYPEKLRVEVWSETELPSEYKLKINLTSAPHMSFRIPKNTKTIDACMKVITEYFEKLSQTDNPKDTI